jgi:hypothetical protein
MNETKTLRVYHIINPPDDPTYRRVGSIEGAVRMIKELAQKDLGDTSITWNAFGLEEYHNASQSWHGFDGWEEWYDEGGFDIQQVMDGESDYYDENGKEKQ